MDCLPTFRYQVEGTRDVVLAPLPDMLEFMLSKGIDDLTPAKAAQFLKMATPGFIEEYLDKGSLYHFTVGPKEVLYTPETKSRN